MCNFADLVESAETYGCGKNWDHTETDKRIVRMMMVLRDNYLLLDSKLSPTLETLAKLSNANILISVEKYKDQKLIEVYYAHQHRTERYPIAKLKLCTTFDGEVIYQIFAEILKSGQDTTFLEDVQNLIRRPRDPSYFAKSRNKKKSTINNLYNPTHR